MQCGFADFQEKGWVEWIFLERGFPRCSRLRCRPRRWKLESELEELEELEEAKDFPAFEAELYSCLDLRGDQNSIRDAYQKNYHKIVCSN